MIRQDQEREQQNEDQSSDEARENVHQQEGGFREPISGSAKSSPLIDDIGRSASGTMLDSDDNCSSPDEEGDNNEEDDQSFSDKLASAQLSFGASPGGIDRLANFPLKLHKMLERAETEGFYTTVSWLHSPVTGRPKVSGTNQNEFMVNTNERRSYTPFKVHNPDKFVQDVIPRFFQMTKFKSFLRQLNIWGFSRDRSKGVLNGSYYHRDFVREDPDLCQKMRRTKNKGMYKRGAKGTSSQPTNKSSSKLGSMAISLSRKDGMITSNSEEAKRDGSSISSTSYAANDVFTTRPDVLNQDILLTAGRNNSTPFPISYRPMMRGLEKEHEQFRTGNLEVRSPSRQIMDGSSQQHQQIFVRTGLEAPVSSQFSLGDSILRATASGHHQEFSVDQQNSMVFPPPLPTPSREMMGHRVLAQGGPTYSSATHPSSNHSPKWHGFQGDGQGVFAQNMTEGQSTSMAGVLGAPENWRSQFESVSGLQSNPRSQSVATVPRSDNISQLLTNPQMAREDLKYILVGFQLGAANKEEDEANAVSSSLEGVEGAPAHDDEHDPSPLPKKSTSR